MPVSGKRETLFLPNTRLRERPGTYRKLQAYCKAEVDIISIESPL